MSKHLHLMLAVVLLLSGCISLHGQNKVQTSVIVVPPYSPHFFELAQQPNGLLVQVNYPDVNVAGQLQLKLLFSLKGDNGVELTMPPSFTPSSPISLRANQSLQLQGRQLAEYFKPENFQYTGISTDDLQYGAGLPEGVYRLCVQAVNYQQPDIVYSTQSCSNPFTIRYLDPPVLIRPQHKQVLTELQSKNVVFSWQPAIGLPAGTQYVLRIVEVTPADRVPADAMESSGTPPFFERTVSTTTFLYTPDLPALLPGKTYAWVVSPIGFKGEKLAMKNGGASEVNSFSIAAAVTGNYCTCSVSGVSIQRLTKAPNLFTYQGTVSGACTGSYYCQGVSKTEYLWTVVSGGAFIDGANNGPTVTVTTNGPAKFTLSLKGSVVCSDSTRCDSTVTIEDSMVYETKKCTCNASISCKGVNKQGDLRTFTGELNGGCNGEFGVAPPYQACAVKNVNWFWTVAVGQNVAEIVGPANQQTVNVKIKGIGPYVMRVQGDVECNDGTKECSQNFDYCPDTVKTKNCGFVYTESNLPAMAGGLSDKTKRRDRIRRDEYVALIADGRDFDKVTIECTPSYECDSSQKKSSREVLLAGKVRFEWEIQTGEGNLVKMGRLPENVRSDVGDRVIFQPPYVPLPEPGQPTNTKTTVIFLRVVDETGVGPLLDQNVYDRVTIITRRSGIIDPDRYDIEVQNIPWTSPAISLQEDNNGVCKANYSWDKKNDLQTPTIKLPSVPDNDKMVLGQWMILEANNQNETDELKMVCESSSCTNDGGKKEYPDNIQWTWTILDNDGTKGRLLGGNTGRYVLYEAPDAMPLPRITEITVNIVVSVANTGVQINDVTFTSRPISFKIYKPGVQLEYPPLTWLPEEANSVSLKSTLLYFSGGAWRPGLAHMGRIHFFELLDVSTEKGVSMNDPVPRRARECRDLRLKKEAHTEVFARSKDPGPVTCRGAIFYLHARTQKPLKDATVNVNAEDWGAYGFLRSFANINQGGRDSIKGESPVYEPVPIPTAQVAHPSGRAKKTVYKDNRVTVPRDVDENRIADGGWTTAGGIRMNDPQNARDDNDPQLPGDGYAGDGLSNYEEYRGFVVSGEHIRTNILRKDLFIHNPNSFNLLTFRRALLNPGVGVIDVHEIEEEEYISNARREVNFNFNPVLHFVPSAGEDLRVQRGIFIRSGIPSNITTNGETLGLRGGLNPPAPPNWVLRVEIYPTNIMAFSIRRTVNFTEKLNQVCAHELGHAVNIWHHGPGGNTNACHGLRSGNMECFMRYDNRLPRVPGFIPEDLGLSLCTSGQGTGYNSVEPCVLPPPGVEIGPANTTFGNAAANRGNCIGQIRISCRTIGFPRRF